MNVKVNVGVALCAKIKIKMKIREIMKERLGRAASMRPPAMINVKISIQAGSSTPPHLRLRL